MRWRRWFCEVWLFGSEVEVEDCAETDESEGGYDDDPCVDWPEAVVFKVFLIGVMV